MNDKIHNNPEDTLRKGYLDTNKIRKPIPIKYDTNTAYTQGYNDGVYDTLLNQLTTAEEHFKDGYSLGFNQGRNATVKNLMSALKHIVDTNHLDASKGKLEKEIEKFIYTYCESARQQK